MQENFECGKQDEISYFEIGVSANRIKRPEAFATTVY
jgi:hypothetical protein